MGFGRELRLCVATRKKLQLYEWRKSTFCPLKVRVVGVWLSLGEGLSALGEEDCKVTKDGALGARGERVRRKDELGDDLACRL